MTLYSRTLMYEGEPLVELIEDDRGAVTEVRIRGVVVPIEVRSGKAEYSEPYAEARFVESGRSYPLYRRERVALELKGPGFEFTFRGSELVTRTLPPVVAIDGPELLLDHGGG